MLFNSINYLVFFPIVLLLYFVLPDKIKRYWLLAASYFFYMCWNAKYILLILFSTIATYYSGILIEKSTKHKKKVVTLCVVANLLLLFFFKYYGFGTDSVSSLFSLFGIKVTFPAIDVILPVGISFYTFQALGYTIDVYRGTIKAEHDFFKYALFVSFFPQLVAGPIERSSNLMPQLDKPHRFDTDRFREGFLLMLWGYFMKVVIADRAAIVVDSIYDNIDVYPGMFQVLAAGLFAFQIYCDFAGYSTIAIGSAKILGIDLMDNFDTPYLATTVTDFWRRWHISLTTWFKDYVYIPLGGNRKGKARKYFNKLLVFAISGLWHGADWSFVVWGFLNGLYQVIGEMLMPIRERIRKLLHINTRAIWYRLCAMAVTFTLVDLAWVFFRAKDIKQALRALYLMFSTFNLKYVLSEGRIFRFGVESPSFRMMVFAVLVLIVADVLGYNNICIRKWIMSRHVVIRSSIVIFSILFILVFGAWGPAFDIANFIYFQF